MTRLTCAFSKKWENRRYALALFFAHYNWRNVHGSLKTTPAVAHGIATETWSAKDLIVAVMA